MCFENIKNHSTANLLSKLAKQIPKAYKGENGYCKSILKSFSEVLPHCK